MLLDERRQKILMSLESKGFASLQELIDSVGASESTIRRDLDYLDGSGQIRRTRGGAAYIGESLTAFEDRSSKASKQKRRIADAVAEEINPGETVILDGGTTTLEVARCLIGKSLQVVTNSVPIVNLLVNQPQIELVFIGGYVYPKTGVALGPIAEATLKNIHARHLVISVGGITEQGLFNSNALLVDTERQMLAAAEKTIVVTDSSKFGHFALAHLCPLDAVDRLFVDSDITAEWQETVRSAGVDLQVVSVK